MPRHILQDAFDHHVWATLRLIDACAELDAAQLATSVPGTYGSILDTLRHLVGADSWYLLRVTGHGEPIEDEERMQLRELRAAVEGFAAAWSAALQAGIDADEVVGVPHEDGSVRRAPKGIRVAQALHHGTDHRSQICTALTTMGIEPPDIDVWAFGVASGRVTEDPPAAG